jgi:hypothetical protein
MERIHPVCPDFDKFESTSLRYNKEFYLSSIICYVLATHANPQTYPH